MSNPFEFQMDFDSLKLSTAKFLADKNLSNGIDVGLDLIGLGAGPLISGMALKTTKNMAIEGIQALNKLDNVADTARQATTGAEATYAGVKEASAYLKSLDISRAKRVQILQSFDVKTINMKVASKETFGLRFYGGNSKPVGSYLFETFGDNINRAGLSLPPEWSTMTGIKQLQINPGSTFIEGITAPQLQFGPQYIGGAKQWWTPWENLLNVE